MRPSQPKPSSRWTAVRRRAWVLLAGAFAVVVPVAAWLVFADSPAADRARRRAADLLQVRGRWFGLARVGFEPMPSWPSTAAPRAPREPAGGPLHRHAKNPRYFADDRGRLVYLTGSHTWTTLQDAGDALPPPAFDYGAFLDRLESRDHNFFRLWRWEHARWGAWTNVPGFRIGPHPYPRTGPGLALDGEPRFDLARFDQAYFDRLRARVSQAGRRGFYVSVMLFNGWSIDDKGIAWGNNPWRAHPFHRDNNVNGVNGDPDGDDRGRETHSLAVPRTLALQEAFVRKVVDTLNDLDNVLYEISNESPPESIAWQYRMIEVVRSREAARPRQHPVGMTGVYPWPNGDMAAANAALAASPADWISPAGDLHARPVADGRQVVVADTDHLCGICGDRRFAWASFFRGENPIFMDVWNCAPWWYPADCARPEWPQVRDSLGDARRLARRVDLAALTPRTDVSSTGYVLVDEVGQATFLVYAPEGREFTVEMARAPGPYAVEWFDPSGGTTVRGHTVEGGGRRTFSPPFRGDAVLHLSRDPGEAAGSRGVARGRP